MYAFHAFDHKHGVKTFRKHVQRLPHNTQRNVAASQYKAFAHKLYFSIPLMKTHALEYITTETNITKQSALKIKESKKCTVHSAD